GSGTCAITTCTVAARPRLAAAKLTPRSRSEIAPTSSPTGTAASAARTRATRNGTRCARDPIVAAPTAAQASWHLDSIPTPPRIGRRLSARMAYTAAVVRRNAPDAGTNSAKTTTTAPTAPHARTLDAGRNASARLMPHRPAIAEQQRGDDDEERDGLP